jgi:hypothetical protein
MKLRLFIISILIALFTTPLAISPTFAIDGAALLTSCANSINDPLYTRDSIATIMGFGSTAALETAITNGTITVYIANGPGVIPGSASSNGNARDLYCGDSNDNSVPFMDSGVGTRDYFFGGAGNDSLTATMWFSNFYGGPGNDYANALEEQSLFEGGPGNDSFGSISTGAWASTFNQGADVVEFSSLSIAGNVKVTNYRESITITAVVSASSRLTFFANGKRIAGCISRSTSGSGSTHTATCSWRPSVIGSMTISATAVPTGQGVANSAQMPSKISIVARSTRR